MCISPFSYILFYFLRGDKNIWFIIRFGKRIMFLMTVRCRYREAAARSRHLFYADQDEVVSADFECVQVGDLLICPEVVEFMLFQIYTEFLFIDFECGRLFSSSHVAYDHEPFVW